MAHNIARINGQDSIAFRGQRKDVWHRLGQEMEAGMSLDQWAEKAGLNWNAIMVPALADLSGPEFSHLTDKVSRGMFTVRSDNGHPLGYVSERYKPVQPREVLDWFQQYIGVDSRFELDVAGALKDGEIIWATATFNADNMTVAGDAHKARLLMSTTFDGTASTINQGTITRTVCNNTLNIALADKRAMVRTRHNTRFDAERVGRELASIANGFDAYRAMGNAMAEQHMSKDVVSKYFKKLLDIPWDAKPADVSARKFNQFSELNDSYKATVMEGTEPETAWTALNAVTRYVDHSRGTRGGSSTDEARFLSAQFGSGATMKAEAVELLTMDNEFKSLMGRSFSPSVGTGNADIAAILSQPFRPLAS